MCSFTKVHVKIFIKGREIIGRVMPCLSDDIIDNAIKFAKFSVADGTEIC